MSAKEWGTFYLTGTEAQLRIWVNAVFPLYRYGMYLISPKWSRIGTAFRRAFQAY
jgi:hypothetical protein